MIKNAQRHIGAFAATAFVAAVKVEAEIRAGTIRPIDDFELRQADEGMIPIAEFDAVTLPSASARWLGKGLDSAEAAKAIGIKEADLWNARARTDDTRKGRA